MPSWKGSNTHFPAGGNQSFSTVTSERLGAFGSLQLEQPTPVHQRPASSGLFSPNDKTYGHPLSVQTNPARSITPVTPRPHHLDMQRTEHVYQPTVSNADTSETRRKYDKLTEVYSTSGDTVEFARNLSQYLNDRIPYGITVAVLVGLIVIAFVLALIGMLNIPFCPVQPMIPIWLIVAGLMFTASAVFRIYHHIPSPKTHNRRNRNLTLSLCGVGCEILFVVANIVWLILGCVWVYGSKGYVHFYENMFEDHYCDPGVYWTAFAAVTGYLVFACLLIVFFVCILAVGSCKETEVDKELEERQLP